MFDIGFSEILVIFVLALIVLGPEKLPAVVRKVGRWVGRARAMARQFQEQLEDEMDFEERRTPASPPLPPDPVVYTEPPPEVTEPAPAVAGDAEPVAADPQRQTEEATPRPAELHEPRA